jgi:peptidoglycan/LPS O-acetylase OafA/YrhL
LRDKELDIFRGLIMIYIIGIIHVVYWGGIIETPWKSLLLFEMPVIFFITGASHTLSKPKPYLEYILKRIKRIMLPYWVYSIVCIFFVLAYYYISKSLTLPPDFSLAKFIFTWLNPYAKPTRLVTYIDWHMWFVQTYLIIILLIPLLYSSFIKQGNRVRILTIAALTLAVYLTDFYSSIHLIAFIKSVLFYLIWTYLGFYYQLFKKLKFNRNYLLIIAVFFAILMIPFIAQYKLNMQNNKFPPNFMFLLFTSCWFCLLVYAKDLILKIASIKIFAKIITIYSTYGYTLYLYQTFSFLALLYLIIGVFKIQDLQRHNVIGTLLSSIFVILFSLIFPFLFGWAENFNFSNNNFFKKERLSNLEN